MQDDWEAKLGGLKNLNLKGKKGAVFGTGDQEGYADSFCDAVGILKDALLSANASLIGSWPADGYTFDSSKASETDNSFAGLVIDEDNQSGVTDERIAAWVSRLAAAIG
ncbi:MAG: flavodoxin domain-containing protein [Spirochaetales bacterium]|nr:flavodoxin domain-containing protein [Spirochaetales bacterium]